MKGELGAISPLDGRYREKVEALSQYFSEGALMRARVEVEARYLMALSTQKVVREFSEDEKKALEALYQNFSHDDGMRIKEIEKKIRHDVKSVEYWMKEKLAETSLADTTERIHFALTSTDTDNLAYALLLSRALHETVLPQLQGLIEDVCAHAEKEKDAVMLARTHGQPAVPTTLGKELAVFAVRLCSQFAQLRAYRAKGKLNGAVGNFNAHAFAAPDVDWISFSNAFIESLGVEPNAFTTQIEPHDRLAELFDIMRRTNAILVDMNRDIWSYISHDMLVLKAVEGEVGSSTMPQKVNPIDFENGEGNAKVANSLFEGLSRELQVSRLQRDLSDTTVKRNIGVALGHSLLAYLSTRAGLAKIKGNREHMQEELAQHYEILSEGYQTLLRLRGREKPYETLKALVRGKRMGREEMQKAVAGISVDSETKVALASLSPQSYVGLARKLTELAVAQCREALK